MRDPNTKLRMILYHTRSRETDKDVAVLEVVDDASSLVFFEVELTPTELVRLLHSTSINAEGWVTPARERIGKKLEIETHKIPENYTPVYVGYVNKSSVYERGPAEGWAAGIRDRDGWEEYSLSQHNHGWDATFRRWVS